MLRRHLELAYFYTTDQEIDWNFHSLLEKADTVTKTESHLSWLDLYRYSNRQQTEMTLGGFIGSLSLKGPLESFGHLLEQAVVFHVGKGTAFGLGKMELKT
jgi:hypothetical protein